jgi:hypothetical protein
MYPVLSECPVCGGEMLATRLNCRACDSVIEGRFYTGPFTSLNNEQLEFVELFIRNEGKLSRMENELSLSYPTIRNRLHEIIRALGYEPGEETINEDERRQVLVDLEAGKIDYEEAMRLLKEGE